MTDAVAVRGRGRQNEDRIAELTAIVALAKAGFLGPMQRRGVETMIGLAQAGEGESQIEKD